MLWKLNESLRWIPSRNTWDQIQYIYDLQLSKLKVNYLFVTQALLQTHAEKYFRTGTFWSPARRFNHWAIPELRWQKEVYDVYCTTGSYVWYTSHTYCYQVSTAFLICLYIFFNTYIFSYTCICVKKDIQTYRDRCNVFADFAVSATRAPAY